MLEACPTLCIVSGPRRYWSVNVAGSSRGRILTNRKLLAADFDDVADRELSASTGLDFAIHFDLAVLDHQLGLPAGT